ncbi:MAG TPA: hypothetical protein HA257_01670 [Candidatus Methanoperedenaceae archaeon]|nr:hypothetical protein [Candidatus Methanoperedenaceae archaeon]
MIFNFKPCVSCFKHDGLWIELPIARAGRTGSAFAEGCMYAGRRRAWISQFTQGELARHSCKIEISLREWCGEHRGAKLLS